MPGLSKIHGRFPVLGRTLLQISSSVSRVCCSATICPYGALSYWSASREQLRVPQGCTPPETKHKARLRLLSRKTAWHTPWLLPLLVWEGTHSTRLLVQMKQLQL